jgi:hypothetical protein
MYIMSEPVYKIHNEQIAEFIALIKQLDNYLKKRSPKMSKKLIRLFALLGWES